MSEESQILVASGSGIQTVVPQLAAFSPQVVYLDFDGAETSYDNRDLDIHIDNIVMEDSGFDSETISLIVDTLNGQFDDDIVFTANIPQTNEYSTIYVGVTSAFDDYGDFLGLAETIDSGNQIHDDNAFVMLNSTASVNLMTSVIAHETEHLVGTLEHGGNGMERYATSGYIYYYYLTNQTFTRNIWSSSIALYQYLSDKDIVSSHFQSIGGNDYVCLGTRYVSANNVTVSFGGVYISSGGVANNTTLNSGWIRISSGGVANYTTVNGRGSVYISSGGVANSTTVNSGGYVSISSGGEAKAVKENGGYVGVDEGAKATFVPNIISGPMVTWGMTLHSGTTANSASVNSGGYVRIYGGVANSTTVNSRGRVYIRSGGVANITTVNECGSYNYGYTGGVYISSGGVANSTTVNSGGRVYISCGGVANSTTVNSRGSVTISSGGTANSTTLNSGGYVWISSGGVANSTTLNSGGWVLIYEGVANSTTVNSVGQVSISSGGVANSTTVNSNGYVTIDSGGVANSTTVNSGGRIAIYSGGVANSTTVNSGGYVIIDGEAKAVKENGGCVSVHEGANATFVPNVISCPIVTWSMTLHSGTTANSATVNSGGYVWISSGGVANITTVNSGGRVYISHGGVANITTVNSGGGFGVSSGGVANNTTVNSGGYFEIYSGGEANSTTVNSGGNFDIYIGGEANSTTVNSGGSVWISSDGEAKAVKENGGYVHVNEGANATFVPNVISCPIVTWSMTLHSGTTANSATVNSVGGVYISSGGVANSTVVNSGGGVYISSGGVANSTTVNSGGSVWIYNEGVANNATINAGAFLRLFDGGVLEGTTDLTGSIWVDYDATFSAANATINLIVDGAPAAVFGEEQHNGYITNLNALSEADLCISITENATAGEYLLAGNIEDYHSNIALSVVGNGGNQQFVWDGSKNSYTPITIGDTTYSLSVQSPYGTELLYLNIRKAVDEIPDQVLEKLSRNSNNVYSIYNEQKVGKQYTVTYEGKNFYFVVGVVGTDKTGFYAMGLQRTDASWNPLGQAVVVCRGSEIDGEARDLDWEDDFNPKGVGWEQFNSQGAQSIIHWLNERNSDSVYFTGHSLGGALAQRFSAKYNGKIGGLVTFNSPGIDKKNIKEIIAQKVHHYIVDGDLISIVGDGYVYGNKDSDSWYTVYQGDNVFYGNKFYILTLDNLSGYLLNRHSQTWTNEGKKQENGSIGTTYSTNANNLSSPNFSFIGSRGNFNGNYARFVLSIATKYGDAFNNLICSCIDKYWYTWGIEEECLADLSTANKLTTRKKAEQFRIDTDYKNFIEIVLGNGFGDQFFNIAPDNWIKGGVDLWENQLVSTKTTKETIHDIGILEYAEDKDNLPDVLYDFSTAEFIEIQKSEVQDSWNILYGTTSYSEAKKVDVLLTINTVKCNWKYFHVPLEQSKRYSLVGVFRGENKEQGQVDKSNIISIRKDEINTNTYIFDDSEVTDYWLEFSINETVIQEMAAVSPTISDITKGTSEIKFFVTDIDASKNEGGGNDEIAVTVNNSIGSASTTIKLSETTVEGVFTGTLDIVGENGFNVLPGENVVLSYVDKNNGTGQQETVTTEIPVLQTDAVVSIDETGLDADYTAITEDTAWYKFNLLVDSNTLAGTYVLAENLDGSQGNCVIWGNDSKISETLTGDADVRIDANTYSKQIIDDKLVLTVKTAPRSIQWEEVEGALGYVLELSQDQFESVIQLQYFGQEHTQVDLLNLPNGEYSYRVRAFENYDDFVDSGLVVVFEDDDWMLTDTITVKNNVVSERRVADEDDRGEFFFGNARGVWGDDYQAQHVGAGEWAGTGETVALTGKNKITDIFQASNDNSGLLLTDDENGDALFLDDIYSAFPEGLDAQSRIAMIGDISGGAGDDIIDLTSQRFDYIGGGMTVRGGLGDDVIWANTICEDHIIWADQRYNWLFGDEGDDRIVGAGCNDVIAGGIGNDSMHGGGGDDIFTFGGNWGNDIVEQLPDGKVTLWFQDGDLSKWDEKTLTYTDGNNSVKVNGVGLDDISLKFSYGNMHPELAFDDQGNVHYGYLAGIGAFDDYVSRKIFDEYDRGMLA